MKAGVGHPYFSGDGAEVQKVSRLSRVPVCVMSQAGRLCSELLNVFAHAGAVCLERIGLPANGCLAVLQARDSGIAVGPYVVPLRHRGKQKILFSCFSWLKNKNINGDFENVFRNCPSPSCGSASSRDEPPLSLLLVFSSLARWRAGSVVWRTADKPGSPNKRMPSARKYNSLNP